MASITYITDTHHLSDIDFTALFIIHYSFSPCSCSSCRSFISKNILNSLGRLSTHFIIFWRSNETSCFVFSCRYLDRFDIRVSLIFVILLSPSWSKTARSSMKMKTVLSLKMGMQQGNSSLNISSFISSGSVLHHYVEWHPIKTSNLRLEKNHYWIHGLKMSQQEWNRLKVSE